MGPVVGTDTNVEAMINDIDRMKITEDTSSISHKVKKAAESKLSKYPEGSIVTKLDSTLEIKQYWLYNEWDPHCQFSGYIRPVFPNRDDLNPNEKNPNPQIMQLILSTFHKVRGNFNLWKMPRESGRWKKIEVANLPVDWITKNVTILYPSKDRFNVTELNGIVLWRDKTKESDKKYELYEGNHRVSALLANHAQAQAPDGVPAVIFIGKPEKQVILH